jgi:rod shape-determining protein MreD
VQWWLRFAGFVLAVAILQASVLAGLNVKPDLLLVLLVFFAIYCSTTEAIITSFAIGFVVDIIGCAMGPYTISFGLFGTLLAYLHRAVAIRKVPYQFAAIFITSLLAGTLAHLLTFLKGASVADSAGGAVLFWTSLYSAMVGPFLFLPSAWWMHINTHRFSHQ